MYDITSVELSKFTVEEQLKFYKDNFEYRHCGTDEFGCGREVHRDWIIYKEELYCSECQGWKVEEDKKKARKEIQELENRISMLKAVNDIGDEVDED